MKKPIILLISISALFACKKRSTSRIKNSGFTKTTEFVKVENYIREVVPGLTPLQLRNPSDANECFIRQKQGYFLCDGTPHFVIDKWLTSNRSSALIRFLPGPNELCLNEAHYIPEGGEKSVQDDSFYLGRCDSETAKIEIRSQNGSLRLGSLKHSNPLVVDLYAPLENPVTLSTKVFDWSSYTPSMNNWDESMYEFEMAYLTIKQLLFGATQSSVRYTGLGPTMPKNVHTSVEIEADGYDSLDSNKISWYANSSEMQKRCEEWCDAYANMQCETWYRVRSAPGLFKRLYATCSLDANYSTNYGSDFISSTAEEFNFYFYKKDSKNLRNGNIQRLAKVETKYKSGNSVTLGCEDNRVCPSDELVRVNYNIAKEGDVKSIYLLKDNDVQGVGSIVLKTKSGQYFLANNETGSAISSQVAGQLGINTAKSPEEHPPLPKMNGSNVISNTEYQKRTYPKDEVCVTAYTDSKYRGKAFKFCQNSSPSRANFSKWNDKISSIKFDGNAEIQIFSGTNFSGNSKILSRNTADLKHSSLNMNDSISSIKFVSPLPTGYKAVPTILEPMNNLSRGEKQLMDKLGAIIPDTPSLTCAQLEASNNASAMTELELTKHATRMSKTEFQKCQDLKYKLAGFYGLTNSKGILSMGATFLVEEQPGDTSGHFAIKPPTDSTLSSNQAKQTPAFGQVESNQRKPLPSISAQRNKGRSFSLRGSFNENSSLGFSRIKEIKWSWETRRLFSKDFSYLAGLSFVVDTTTMQDQNISSSEETVNLISSPNPNSENYKKHTDLENLGLCRVEYLEYPKAIEVVRRSSQPSARYSRKTIPASVYPNLGAIYALKLYFAPKVNGAWDNNSSEKKLITIQPNNPSTNDFESNQLEGIQTAWKRAFPVNGKVGSFCSTSDTNEVTGYRTNVAGPINVKSTAPLTTHREDANIPSAISWMQLYYGSKPE